MPAFSLAAAGEEREHALPGLLGGLLHRIHPPASRSRRPSSSARRSSRWPAWRGRPWSGAGRRARGPGGGRHGLGGGCTAGGCACVRLRAHIERGPGMRFTGGVAVEHGAALDAAGGVPAFLRHGRDAEHLQRLAAARLGALDHAAVEAGRLAAATQYSCARAGPVASAASAPSRRPSSVRSASVPRWACPTPLSMRGPVAPRMRHFAGCIGAVEPCRCIRARRRPAAPCADRSGPGPIKARDRISGSGRCC